MLNVTKSLLMSRVVMVSVAMLSAGMLSAVMPSVGYAECHLY
jgi:hypothetical protein